MSNRVSQTGPQGNRSLTAEVPDELAGERLDRVLALLFEEYSRSRLQTWIKDGKVTVNGDSLRPRDKVAAGDAIIVDAPPEVETRWQPQPLPLEVVFEDEALLVIDKPAGLVAHPAAGNPDGTLVNALLHHAPELAEVPRAGLIHRLDKDTTGLLVIARTLEAHTHLGRQLAARQFLREYRALVHGVVTGGGLVDEPLGRHPVDRKRMAVVASGRPSVTHYRVLQRFAHHSELALRLETGRTHQIRVHMAHIHHPIVGDPAYGGRRRIPSGAGPLLLEALAGFRRQALHAGRLGLTHPLSGEWLEWQAELPEDFVQILARVAEPQL